MKDDIPQFVKIAILQLNPTIGDLEGNARRILAAHDRAASLGADLAITPELALIGYPPKDLLDREYFIADALQTFESLVPRVKGTGLLLGTILRNPDRGKPLHNAAVLIEDGRVVSRHAKSLLPTYDVFDESRYFQPAASAAPAVFRGRRLGITVCEDMWTVVAGPPPSAPRRAGEEGPVPRSSAPSGAAERQGTSSDRNYGRRDPAETYATDPVKLLGEQGVDVFLNLSASPYTMNKPRTRERLLRAQVTATRRPFVFVNQVGGNDDLLFDGNSLAMTADGQVAARAGEFVEAVTLVDLDRLAPYEAEEDTAAEDEIPALYKALVMGTRDYVRKCGFTKAVVGLSGGIDSALVACIAADAIGPENVLGVSMPSRFSSEGSRTDAQRLAANLGIGYRVIPIDSVFQRTLDTLVPSFEGRPPDITEENLQARIRGTILMAVSNKFGHLVLSTGNKSELAAGYCTLYGDMCGGLAVISDVPKTIVYRLSRQVVNAERERIPLASITKPPSAELRPDQKDSDSLPEYDVLDPILRGYVEDGLSPADLVLQGYDRATVERVVRLVDTNEYKRRQAAVGLKVTGKAFGTGRRFAIAQGYRPGAGRHEA